MRVLSLLFLLAALLPRPALAQPKTTPATATPILYSRHLPKSVAQLMPRGAKSLFWGTFSPKKGRARMAVHFVWIKPLSHVVERSLFRFYYSLDVFEEKSKGWRRIANAPLIGLASNGIIDEGPIFRCHFLWINKKEQQLPLLVFNAFNKDGIYNTPEGTTLFVSFARGWRSTPAVQTFTFGSWFSSDSIGQANSLEVNGRGQIQIAAKIFPPSDDPPRILRFPWNAELGKFWPDASTQKLIDDPRVPYRKRTFAHYFSLE